MSSKKPSAKKPATRKFIQKRESAPSAPSGPVVLGDMPVRKTHAASGLGSSKKGSKGKGRKS